MEWSGVGGGAMGWGCGVWCGVVWCGGGERVWGWGLDTSCHLRGEM